MQGAAMGQQQRLVYDNAVVDMDIPQQKWALRTAPVAGMLSGDLFMADADLNNQTMPWEVGAFDANGRNHTTGNASFWLSLYSQTIHKGNNSSVKDTTYTASAEWSKVTNAMRYSLAPAQGWAVYTRTKSGSKPVLRLPKKDDIYYYYTKSGEKSYDVYEQNLQAQRTSEAEKTGSKAGELTFKPGVAATQEAYTLTNEAASTSFVFGNPAMGYIDIWGFIEDNTSLLKNEFRYVDGSGNWQTVTAGSLVGVKDTIVSLVHYLPPMHESY